jgi:hypothetical protein
MIGLRFPKHWQYHISRLPVSIEQDEGRMALDRASSGVNVRNGSWSCKNGLAVALTPRDIGDVAVRGHFRRLVDFPAWKRF